MFPLVFASRRPFQLIRTLPAEEIKEVLEGYRYLLTSCCTPSLHRRYYAARPTALTSCEWISLKPGRMSRLSEEAIIVTKLYQRGMHNDGMLRDIERMK